MKTKMFSAGAGIAALCAVLILAGGCTDEKAGQGGHGGAVEVVVHEMRPQTVHFNTTLAGRVSAYQISEVRPQVNGILQQRLFEEGADVQAGQVLYQIDPAMYKAAYDSARSSLARAEANVLPARLKFNRYRQLVNDKAVSRQEYEDADAAYKQALADVAVCKAALETARINLDYTQVKAPIAGRISRSSVTPGALMTQNQASPLATVRQLDPVYVDMPQSATEVLRLRRSLASGQLRQADAGKATLRLFLEDGSEYAERGALQFKDVSVEESTGSVTLRALFPNAAHLLLPGMYVRVELSEGANDAALLLPQPALMRDARGEARVFVVNEKNMVEARPVTVSRTQGADWVVQDGLRPGERVIVEGIQKVRPGATVRVAVPPAPTATPATPASVTSAPTATPASVPPGPSAPPASATSATSASGDNAKGGDR